jgi:hypothetical protein
MFLVRVHPESVWTHPNSVRPHLIRFVSVCHLFHPDTTMACPESDRGHADWFGTIISQGPPGVCSVLLDSVQKHIPYMLLSSYGFSYY